jgi:hypothetical protein
MPGFPGRLGDTTGHVQDVWEYLIFKPAAVALMGLFFAAVFKPFWPGPMLCWWMIIAVGVYTVLSIPGKVTQNPEARPTFLRATDLVGDTIYCWWPVTLTWIYHFGWDRWWVVAIHAALTLLFAIPHSPRLTSP